MPYTPDGKYWRMKSSGIKCNECDLPFLAGHVAAPDANGRRICRDCRVKVYGGEALRRRARATDNGT